MQAIQKKYAYWLSAVVILIGLYWFLGFHEAVFYRPISIHQSAQASRASVALNYAQNGMNFFQPQVHGCKNTTGITGSEFPIMNYGAAVCYKLFGFHDFWYRFLMLVSISFGIFFGIKTARFYVSNFYVAMLISFLWFLSPVLVYYSPNFNPDTASLAFMMISWYYFFAFLQNRKNSQIILWAVFLALAGLIKVLALINIVVIIAILVLQYVKYLRLNISRKQVFYFLLSIVAISIMVFVWYRYAKYLSVSNGNFQFSLRTYPAKSFDSIQRIWKTISWQWIPYYYGYTLYVFLGLSAIISVIFYTSVSRLLFVITTLLYLGALAVFIIMGPQFPHHDYYIITLLPAVFFHILMFFNAFMKLHFRYVLPTAFLLLLAGVVHSAVHAQKHQKSRYGGLYYSWEKDFSPYYSLEKHIRALGINHDEKFVVYPDWTPNNSLYLINQKGWTISQNRHYFINALKDCKYALIADTSILHNKKHNIYLNEPIAVFPNNLVLFKISHNTHTFDSIKVFKALDSLWAPYKKIQKTSFEPHDIFTKSKGISSKIHRSGNYAISVSKDNERYTISKIPNNYYTIRVTAYVYGNPKQAKLVCSHAKSRFYKEHTPAPKYDTLSWNKIELLYTKRYLSKIDSLDIYFKNSDTNKVFFDDVTIELIQ